MKITLRIANGVMSLLLPGLVSAVDIQPGALQVTGFGGGVHARAGGQGSTKGLGGGGLTVAAHRSIWVVGEFGYIPLGSFSVAALELPGGIVTGSASGRLYAFDGGLHFSIPAGGSKAAPYVAIGAGVGRFSGSGQLSVGIGSQRSVISFDESETNLGVGGGFGLRYWASDKWGFRPEVRISRYFAEGGGVTVVRFTFGVFYNFGK